MIFHPPRVMLGVPAALLAGLVMLTACTPPPAKSPSVSFVSSAQADPAAATADPHSPTDIAVAWLVAYRTTDYTQPPTAWIHAVAPYVTQRFDQTDRALLTSRSGGGAGWADYVQRRCSTAVHDPVAVIPPEAPHTLDLVHVQAAATLATTCELPAGSSTETVAVTLTVVLTPQGWRVDRREN